VEEGANDCFLVSEAVATPLILLSSNEGLESVDKKLSLDVPKKLSLDVGKKP
jgi:hypothetical protein